MIHRPASPDILVGPSTGAQLLSEKVSKSSFLLIDDALADRIPCKENFASLNVSAATTLESAWDLSKRLQNENYTEVFAFGGGNTIDLATLGIAMACTPPLYDFLKHRIKHTGFLMIPPPERIPLPLFIVPSTVGSGAECSTSACFEWEEAGNSYKSIAAVPHVRAQAIAYDPMFLHRPDGLAYEGVFEIIVRVLASAAETPSVFLRAEQDASYLLGLLADPVQRLREGDSLTDDEDLTTFAIISGESHAGWTLRGRGAAPSSLWFLANELSMAGKLRKNEAMRLLLVPWLAELSRSRGPWRRAEAVRLLCRKVSSDQWSGGEGWLDEIFPLPQRPDIDLEQLSRRVLKRFGGGRPMNRTVDQSLILRVFGEALKPAPIKTVA